MLGTRDHPWIDTDTYLDIERLKSLELDIMKGIALSESVPAGYGTRLDPAVIDNHWGVAFMQTVPDTVPFKAVFNELGKIEKPLMRARAQMNFMRLGLGIYSGGGNVPLRVFDDYSNKNIADHCHDTTNIDNFPTLMGFIHDLPFTEIGRIDIFFNEHNCPTPIHSDGPRQSHRDEFLWFRPNLRKKMFIYDEETKSKSYITSYSAFFDEKSWHGTDPDPLIVFSIRVDGFFTPDFRDLLGLTNLQSYH